MFGSEMGCIGYNYITHNDYVANDLFLAKADIMASDGTFWWAVVRRILCVIGRPRTVGYCEVQNCGSGAFPKTRVRENIAIETLSGLL